MAEVREFVDMSTELECVAICNGLVVCTYVRAASVILMLDYCVIRRHCCANVYIYSLV